MHLIKTKLKLFEEFKRKYNSKLDDNNNFILNVNDIRLLRFLDSPCSFKYDELIQNILVRMEARNTQTIKFRPECINLLLDFIAPCVYKQTLNINNKLLKFMTRSDDLSNVDISIRGIVDKYALFEDILKFDIKNQSGFAANQRFDMEKYIVKYLKKNPDLLTEENMALAAKYDFLEVIKYGVSQDVKIRTLAGIDLNNHEKIFKWVTVRLSKSILFTANFGTAPDSLLDWVLARLHIHFNTNVWYDQGDGRYQSYPQNWVNFDIEERKIELLDLALEKGYINVLDWLGNLSKKPKRPTKHNMTNIIINSDYYNHVSEERILKLLNWGASQKRAILPNSAGMTTAARRNYVDVLEWGYNRTPKILPTKKFIKSPDFNYIIDTTDTAQKWGKDKGLW
ncbi:MAG: hypothetical protein JKX76_01415 [Colwellia sp.]|nr:hypothetical protein [Colwellia sp.]